MYLYIYISMIIIQTVLATKLLKNLNIFNLTELSFL